MRRSPWIPSQPLHLAVSGALATALLVLLFFYAGISSVIQHVRSVDPGVVGLAALMTGLVVGSRTIIAATLYSVAVDDSVSKRFYLGYPVVGLFRVFLPGGYISGSILGAYVLGKSLDRSVGPLLVTFAVAELIQTVVSVAFFLCALALLNDPTVDQFLVGSSGGALAAGVVVLVTVSVVLGRYRDHLLGTAGRVVRLLFERSPIVQEYRRITNTDLAGRVSPLASGLSRISEGRFSLLIATTFASVAQLAVVVALSVSVQGVGGELSLTEAAFSMFPSRLGGLGFLPGGIGGVESAMTGLVMLFTRLERAEAVAGTVVFRLSTFWLEAAIGVIAGGLLLYFASTSKPQF